MKRIIFYSLPDLDPRVINHYGHHLDEGEPTIKEAQIVALRLHYLWLTLKEIVNIVL